MDYNRSKESADYINQRTSIRPQLGIICGSGQGKTFHSKMQKWYKLFIPALKKGMKWLEQICYGRNSNGLGLKCIFLFVPASLASLLENHTEIPYADIPHFPVSDSLKQNTFYWKYISNVIHFRNLQHLDISPHFLSEH